MAQPSDPRREGSPLGSCPRCGTVIPAGYELIRYETAAGRRRRYAECPECRDVVHPA